MAPAAIKRKRAAAPVDPELETFQKAAILEMLAKGAGTIHEIDGTPMGTVKFKDGTYHNRPLLARQEFAFKGGYVGKRGKVIFTFEPVDAAEFALLELDQDQVDTVLPMFTPAVAQALDYETESAVQLLSHLIGRAQLAASAAKEAAANELKRGAENHKNYGMFA